MEKHDVEGGKGAQTGERGQALFRRPDDGGFGTRCCSGIVDFDRAGGDLCLGAQMLSLLV
jgi:hypothetical protein